MANISEYQRAGQEKLAAALGQVFDALNVLGSKNDAFVKDYFARQHRTLQQQFFKVIVLPVVEQLAEAQQSGRVDGRNEAAARLAVKFLEGVNEEDKYLPLV